MNKQKIPRWTGKTEIWFNDNKNIIVVRSALSHCEVLKLDQNMPSYWSFAPFKEPWTFDFYNGSKYLVNNGFTLMERL